MWSRKKNYGILVTTVKKLLTWTFDKNFIFKFKFRFKFEWDGGGSNWTQFIAKTRNISENGSFQWHYWGGLVWELTKNMVWIPSDKRVGISYFALIRWRAQIWHRRWWHGQDRQCWRAWRPSWRPRRGCHTVGFGAAKLRSEPWRPRPWFLQKSNISNWTFPFLSVSTKPSKLESSNQSLYSLQ